MNISLVNILLLPGLSGLHGDNMCNTKCMKYLTHLIITNDITYAPVIDLHHT